ncbi:mechanosensitive ion channel family protein [Brevundimonas diminuta]|uniref:mechanosensitive ion channel family protein n=1 Tax=Brevundimonas diminuta TaxID=293 RepID=UPI000207F11F|nr:mechanosensitive ion channel family protein [Brevundimonas diminuta]EGF94078.1 mechanosensitive ion channel family protein [Brevundimonas diminuta ATCC 11568]OWR20315.1 mechanosensitive ion channel protein MscS [Brevundimonas diminuta]WQE43973.1 mechanosensitive ion channel family protein [Brevundimonas diminuta]SUW16464.1 Miniconductance mechanosensitive channel [Brevundimonas diminuta]
MFDFIAMRDRLAEFPIAEMLIGLCLLVLVAFIADFVVRRILTRLILRIVGRAVHDLDVLLRPVVRSFTRVVPAVIIHQGIGGVPHLAPGFVTLVQNVAGAFMIVAVAIGIGAGLDMANALYARSPRAHRRSIKGYLQVLKIVIYAIATILVIAALIDRSPLLLLSGLGALAAVLMLVFKDTILSLVASVQLNSNDMLRVGDWIEMPQVNADGDVIDIALHTVKVQNWDKTITTIPTWRLISESYRNWRGMQDSGGRRIKRSLLIDQTSARFLTEAERERMRRFLLIDDYLADKSAEMADWNAKLVEAGRDPVNMRRSTNIGAFRAYVQNYLENHPRIRQDMTLLVRQMQPTETGLPLEIYAFTATVAWAEYEAIQADIFDHLLAILPEFDLRLFQSPSGADFVQLRRPSLAA